MSGGLNLLIGRISEHAPRLSTNELAGAAHPTDSKDKKCYNRYSCHGKYAALSLAKSCDSGSGRPVTENGPSSNGKWTTTNRIHGRIVVHGKRGALRQRWCEGQDDQLGALGLVVDMIVLWNTPYMQAAIDQPRAEGYPVLDEDIPHLSPHVHDHINMPGRYSFSIPESVSCG